MYCINIQNIFNNIEYYIDSVISFFDTKLENKTESIDNYDLDEFLIIHSN